MRQSHLERLHLVGNKSGQNGRNGRPNVCTKCHGKHLLQWQYSHTHQWSQCGRRNGGRLDEDRNGASNGHGKVPIEHGGLVNHTRGNSQKHALQGGNETRQTDNENDQAEKEADAPGYLVVPLGRVGLEKGRTVSRLFVASNQTDLARLLGGLLGIVTLDGIKVVARLGVVVGNGLNEFLIGNDNLGSERRHDSIDGAGPLFSIPDRIFAHNGIGKIIQISGNGLDGKENGNRGKVEYVVDGRTRKGSLELIQVIQLGHGNNRIGHARTDIGTHNHVDRLTSRENIGSDEGHHNGSGRRG
mmetsp:Transcript_8852/g.20483  ORF Transcript_8852/g.20483 Transcript_8852/m.20483 type:complete len:300 (-) Transcript_8852:207-1106(-)